MSRRGLMLYLSAALMGVLVSDTARAVQQSQPQGADWRSGTVVGWDNGRITIRVADGQSLGEFPYITSYLPLLGDEVEMLRRGDTWIVLGAMAGPPANNAVANPSFEDSTTGSLPSSWSLYHEPGGLAVAAVTTEPAPIGFPLDGPQVLRVSTTGVGAAPDDVSTDYVTSAPISVVPGQRWAANARVFGDYTPPAGRAGINASVLLTWYANATDVYPNTVALDSLAATAPIAGHAHWVALQTPGGPGETGGIVVPAGANWMRVALLTTIRANGTTVDAFWDQVVARRLPGA